MNIYRTDGTVETVTKDRKDITLEWFYSIVGNPIEMVPLPNNKVLICNEEGMRFNLPPNVGVTEIVKGYVLLPPGGFLLGNAIIANEREIEDEE